MVWFQGIIDKVSLLNGAGKGDPGTYNKDLERKITPTFYLLLWSFVNLNIEGFLTEEPHLFRESIFVQVHLANKLRCT